MRFAGPQSLALDLRAAVMLALKTRSDEKKKKSELQKSD